jgi:hypothetical protein
MDVELHLAMLSEAHLGPETLSEALNRERAFVPVKDCSDESHFLVRRSSIRSVRIRGGSLADDERHPSERDAFAEPERLRELQRGGLGFVDVVLVELSGGGTVEGTLVTVMPPSSSRLSDYFNTNEATFFPVFEGDDIVYVNKDWIATVKW